MTAVAERYALPTGWTLTDEGLSYDGCHALDMHLYLDTDGNYVAGDPTLRRTVVLPPVHELWSGSEAEWIIEHVAVPDEHRSLLQELAQELVALRAAEFPTQTLLQAAGWDVGNEEIAALLLHMSQYLLLTEIDHILVVLATGVAPVMPGDPVWPMLIAASSSGKEEALRLLALVRDAELSDVSVPGLLSNKGSGGILKRLQDRDDALLVIPDFSTVLSGDGGKRSGDADTKLFDSLRRVYDGSLQRDINPTPVSWSGRVTMIAACTPVIDSFAAHADALGTRWLQFRMPEHDDEMRRSVVQLVVNRDNEKIAYQRAEASEIAAGIIKTARSRVPHVQLPQEIKDLIVDAGNLGGYGRASVPRDWRSEVSDIVTPEAPGRLAGQLKQLALGLYALGVRHDVVVRVVRHAALSSMPVARARTLQVLIDADEPLSTYAVGKLAGIHKNVAKRALEDWQQIGFASSLADEAADEAPLASRDWVLRDVDGVVRRVFP